MNLSLSGPMPATVAQLQAMFDYASSVYLLIDPMVGEPILLDASLAMDFEGGQAARTMAWRREVTVIPLNSRIPLAAHLHPYLVTMHGLEDEWLAASLAMSHAEREQLLTASLGMTPAVSHRISWLQTSLFAQELAETLSPMFEVRCAVNTPERYLRLADRRVMAWLRCVLGDARLTAQFGRLQRWVYLDVQGQLAQLAHEEGEGDAQPLRFAIQEWAQARRGQEVHGVAALWLAQCQVDALPVLLSSTQIYSDAMKALHAAAKVARRWPERFISANDHVVWAALSLLHPGVENSPQVQAMLDNRPELGQSPEPIHEIASALHAIASIQSPSS